MDGSNETASASQRRREEIDDLLSGTFNSILRIEEQSLDNRLTHGLTITEVHTIVAIGPARAQSDERDSRAPERDLGYADHGGEQTGEQGLRGTYARRGRSSQGAGLAHQERQAGAARAQPVPHQMIDEALGRILTEEEERVFAGALKKVKGFFDAQA